MQIDIDYTLDTASEAVLRIYGLTEEGYSVLVNVTGFVPYFWVPATAHTPINSSVLQAIKDTLNVKIM